jgi:hypothetical protein
MTVQALRATMAIYHIRHLFAYEPAEKQRIDRGEGWHLRGVRVHLRPDGGPGDGLRLPAERHFQVFVI